MQAPESPWWVVNPTQPSIEVGLQSNTIPSGPCCITYLKSLSEILRSLHRCIWSIISIRYLKSLSEILRTLNPTLDTLQDRTSEVEHVRLGQGCVMDFRVCSPHVLKLGSYKGNIHTYMHT